MYELRYLEQARADLVRIKHYIAKESGSNDLALKYTEKLRQQCRKLAELPGTMGTRPELMEDVRSFPHDSYIYPVQVPRLPA